MHVFLCYHELAETQETNKKGGYKMFDKNKLKAKIVENGYTLEQIAQKLGINPATMYRKMTLESDFTRNEIAILKEVLCLTIDEINAIFFA